ncbi:MAG: hypothetical protein ACM34K_04225, partial [Bacillota bacterium]
FSFSFLFFLTSCEEDFTPKAQFRQYYVLNCAIGVEDPANPYAPLHEIKAVVNKTYDQDGFIPTGSGFQLVRDVNLSIIKKSEQFYFTDTLKTKEGFSLLDYYTPVKSPKLFPLDKIRISAVMPDGVTVSAESTVPLMLSLEFAYEFVHGITPNVNQFLAGKGVTVTWENNYSDHLLFPEMSIPYRIISTGQTYSLSVPLKYIQKDGKRVPLYTSAVKNESVTFEFEAIDSALAMIASLAPKNDIEIGNCEFKVMEFDNNLSNYYSSTNGYLDSYSVRLDDNIYTNIRGGFGVFGSYFVNRLKSYFDKSYIESFGYKYRRF